MTPAPPSGGRAVVGIAVLLFAVTAALYGRAAGFEFLNYDDPAYVEQNEHVNRGLTLDGIAFAFTGPHSANWHPLTTLSHQLDVELFGLDPGGHHLTSVLLHALNAALCFLALWSLTRRFGTSAIVAALFALHPLRVESVAWISERKDVLSGTFFFLTLIAWARYARRPSAARYAVAAALFAASLMAKQMAVTLPALLLLFDVWPLRRCDCLGEAEGDEPARKSVLGLVVEKLPLAAIALGATLLLWNAQRTGGTVGSLGALSVAERVANAFGACLAYVRLTLMPTGLACFYPHPALLRDVDPTRALWIPAALGTLLVLGVSVLCLRRLRRTPELAVGWFWFLGMLVPVIGLVQVGSQAYADRYTYLPAIGLALAVVGFAVERVSTRPALRRPALGALALVLVALAGATWRYLGFWSDSGTLNRRALAVTDNNYVAHNNLGLVHLFDENDPVLAEEQFVESLRLNPAFPEAIFNLGFALEGQGRGEAARRAFEDFARLSPTHPAGIAKLAAIRRRSGEAEEALALWKRMTEQTPDDPRAWIELARVHLDLGQGSHAAEGARKALELASNRGLPELLAEAHIVAGQAADALGYRAEAGQHFQSAVDAAPDLLEARLLLARAIASTGALDVAKAEVLRALEIDAASPTGRVLLAKILLGEGEDAAGREELLRALQEDPDHVEGNELLGTVLNKEGDRAGAEKAYLRALDAKPDHETALHNLGLLYESTGRDAEALERLRRLLDVNAESALAPSAARVTAWILATSPEASLRDGDEAVRMATFALRGGNPEEAVWHIAMAAALAEAGRFEEAVEALDRAIQLSRSDQQKRVLQKRRELHAAGKPFHRAR